MDLLGEIELFDSHLHIIDPRFPLIPNHGYLPEAFTCDDYLARLSQYKLVGGVVVSGSFQGFDQSYLLSALKSLGASYVGVTQLPYATSDQQIMQLDAAGVRALRFNLYRGGSENVKHMVSMAHRVYDRVGWHVELYVDATKLEELSVILNQLPAVCIDHLGMSKQGLPYLLKLAEKGVKIKATGFGRIDFKASEAIRLLYLANPESLMFGSDLPSTRAPIPFQHSDIDIVLETLGGEAAQNVFKENAMTFYNLKSRE
ncbi:amidohydrolase family protein [Celerinatantimonas sp. YJH-8]|uniref:amidohydrolase family protein n=1 Tax=Celerinatantimonas sp. YJH-8 TaxID=3228714 RepID=UPI0038C61B42